MLKKMLCLIASVSLLFCSTARAEDLKEAIAKLPDDALIALHVMVLEELENRDIGNARKQQLQLEYSRYEEHIASGIELLSKTVFFTAGIEQKTNPELVWISESGARYHTIPECCGMKNPAQVPVERAVIKGLTPCKDCAYWISETGE